MGDSTFIQFQASKEEKQLLTQLAERNGRASISATLRRLIRDEATRYGVISQSDSEPQQTN